MKIIKIIGIFDKNLLNFPFQSCPIPKRNKVIPVCYPKNGNSFPAHAWPRCNIRDQKPPIFKPQNYWNLFYLKKPPSYKISHIHCDPWSSCPSRSLQLHQKSSYIDLGTKINNFGSFNPRGI